MKILLAGIIVILAMQYLPELLALIVGMACVVAIVPALVMRLPLVKWNELFYDVVVARVPTK